MNPKYNGTDQFEVWGWAYKTRPESDMARVTETAARMGERDDSNPYWMPVYQLYMARESPAPDAAADLCDRICAAIKAADDRSVDEADYMLDSDHCIRIVRELFATASHSALSDVAQAVLSMTQCAQCGEQFSKPVEPHVHCPACCRRDSDRLDAIASEYLYVEPFDMPTGMGDADVGWRIRQDFGGTKGIAVVAEVYEDDLRAAIDAATGCGTQEPAS